jgi:ADP-heptose:LPS heptosyltransferase
VDAERIIIYRLGSLGDTITALPCFHLIERAYPDAERIVLTNIPESRKAAPLQAILAPSGLIHGAIPYPLGVRDPRELWVLRARLRELNAHTLVYLTRRYLGQAWRDVGFFGLCGFDRIIGAPLRADLQANRVDPAGRLERESHRLARTIACLGPIDFVDRAWWDLRLTDQERARARHQLGEMQDGPFVAVNTGGKAWQKDWGAPAWAALLGALGSELAGFGLVFVGGGEDRERAAALSAAWPGPLIDLCGRLTPRESAAALSAAALFIGHDSGPFHLADAVGTPAVGLFGDYNRPDMWHPSGPDTRVIHQMSGLAQIAPREVLETALALTTTARRA